MRDIMTIENLTVVLIIVTAIYAYLTYRISVANEKSVAAINFQTESMLRPYVVVEAFFRPNTAIINLRIKNHGKSGAENLTIEIDRDFFQLGNEKRNLKKLSAFNSKIDLLAPQSELLFTLASAQEIFSENANEALLPKKFSIKTSYSFGTKTITENHNIDLNPFLGASTNKDPLIEEIAKIRQVLEK